MSRGRKTRGFALMLAIFLIVTLAAAGLYLVTVSTGQAQAVTQDVLATRAYQAARAGLERGIYERLINSSCTIPPITFANPGLNGFRAEVSCTRVTPVAGEVEGGAPAIHVYLIVSRGCNANPCTPGIPGPGYVERELQVAVSQ
jgi:MSHA biogenesis protein MshP